eukprot:CAMPEP_0173322996 /NCGR_PEP_ID=MMETSP1143-20121109/30287_1 /TAXON_ID=483371 /ORGANISM="non described non described, Strain CCMP2298" /LENGTH=98 /DNA_ID=CAMNT_0014266943 /DNA_START=127 /DNA_END=423 /DNA_ORIENTATION=+
MDAHNGNGHSAEGVTEEGQVLARMQAWLMHDVRLSSQLATALALELVESCCITQVSELALLAEADANWVGSLETKLSHLSSTLHWGGCLCAAWIQPSF